MLRLRSSTAVRLASTVGALIVDFLRFLRAAVRSTSSLTAENPFLRKQLAFYREHEVKPHRLTDPTRILLVLWSRLFNWKEALMIVQPETLIRWHRQGFKLFWRWKSKAGRPRLPRNIRELIAQMTHQNATWGQARVASELSLKLEIYVSPRTMRAYWPSDPDRRTSSQHRQTFVRNYARAVLACDFLVVVTARFRVLYVFVIMEIGTRRIVHCNVTSHPTAGWTLQQFREAIPSDHRYRFLIHDRDAIFSGDLDRELQAFGVKVLRTPVLAPKANAYCERLVGTVRRECLDFLIPLSEKHLRMLLKEWVQHCNQGRPHMSLGPGIPFEAKESIIHVAGAKGRHHWPDGCALRVKPVLGGLHHEYHLEKIAA